MTEIKRVVNEVLMHRWSAIASILLFAWSASDVAAVETVRFRVPAHRQQPARELEIEGEILVEAQDGGLMLQTDEGRIWQIQPKQILDRQSDDRELVPIDDDEMRRRMLKEVPDGFDVYQTAHYVIVHHTNETYVRQVAQLFERLYKGFFTYWKNQGWVLPEPRFPLVAFVYGDHQEFVEFASDEIGPTAKTVIGYYHLSSNRMTTFQVPNLERAIATIIHEATHQLAYNCGVQRRFAFNPMWVSEGMATFFEAPDFTNARGWRAIGLPNQVNLRRWRKYEAQRPAESLETLVGGDDRFRSTATAESAYAEAWALTYFLLKTHRRKEYVEFLQKLSEGKPLVEPGKAERIAMFEEVFGDTIDVIDRELVNYMKRVRNY